MMRNNRYESVLDAIGNTPLIKLSHIATGLKANIYAKLEFLNPGGSTKDRIALYMVEKAEREGKIKPGDTILENSSGNTAMGLAIICRHKGYKLKIVIRDTTSKEKIKMLEVLGVDVIKVRSEFPPEHPDSYNNAAQKLSSQHPDWYYIDQHNNLDNNEAHYMTTGPEIWDQTEGKVDYLVVGVGTGGTLFGAGKYLREKNPNVKLIGVDPIGSIYYDWLNHKKLITHYRYLIEGMGDEFLIKTATLDMMDDMIQVENKTAFDWTKKIAFDEGLLVGGSSGANMYAAYKVAKEVGKAVNVVTVFCDSGYKYFSTIYNDEWLEKNNLV